MVSAFLELWPLTRSAQHKKLTENERLKLESKIGAESNLGDGTIELQCYERTSTPGGTWLQWTYPGVACDSE